MSNILKRQVKKNVFNYSTTCFFIEASKKFQDIFVFITVHVQNRRDHTAFAWASFAYRFVVFLIVSLKSNSCQYCFPFFFK